MHRLVTAAAIAGLLSPVLSGCDGDTAKATPTTTPTTPSVTVSSPATTTPTPTTPTTPAGPSIPAQAKDDSIPGAKAFVRFYVGAMNTSIQARSSTLVRRLSTTECVTCRGIASSMDKIRRNHGFYHGGDWIITTLAPVPLQKPHRPIIHTAITVSAGLWKRSASDHPRKIEADKIYVDVQLLWAKTNWLVTSIVSA